MPGRSARRWRGRTRRAWGGFGGWFTLKSGLGGCYLPVISLSALRVPCPSFPGDDCHGITLILVLQVFLTLLFGIKPPTINILVSRTLPGNSCLPDGRVFPWGSGGRGGTSQLSPCLGKGTFPAAEPPGKCFVSSDPSGKSFWDGSRAGSSAGGRKAKYPRAAVRVFLSTEAAENTPVLRDIPVASPPAFPRITERKYSVPGSLIPGSLDP